MYKICLFLTEWSKGSCRF